MLPGRARDGLLPLEFLSAVSVPMWLCEHKDIGLANGHSCPCESGVLKEACEGDALRGKSELLLIVQCKPFLSLVLSMGELFSRFVTRIFMEPS